MLSSHQSPQKEITDDDISWAGTKVYWYAASGRSVGFATTGVRLNSADTRNDNGRYRMSWLFPGTGWRCGMQKENYNNLQRVATYYGVSTTTTTTTTTLVQLFLKTWVLPGKISWTCKAKGSQKLCKKFVERGEIGGRLHTEVIHSLMR